MPDTTTTCATGHPHFNNTNDCAVCAPQRDVVVLETKEHGVTVACLDPADDHPDPDPWNVQP